MTTPYITAQFQRLFPSLSKILAGLDMTGEITPATYSDGRCYGIWYFFRFRNRGKYAGNLVVIEEDSGRTTYYGQHHSEYLGFPPKKVNLIWFSDENDVRTWIGQNLEKLGLKLP